MRNESGSVRILSFNFFHFVALSHTVTSPLLWSRMYTLQPIFSTLFLQGLLFGCVLILLVQLKVKPPMVCLREEPMLVNLWEIMIFELSFLLSVRNHDFWALITWVAKRGDILIRDPLQAQSPFPPPRNRFTSSVDVHEFVFQDVLTCYWAPHHLFNVPVSLQTVELAVFYLVSQAKIVFSYLLFHCA